VLLLLPFLAIAEQDWTPSSVTMCHLQSLTNQGFMTVAELPTLTEGYVVTFVAFYERDSVRHRIGCFACCYATMAWSCTI
jgi:hypothetical protein